MSLCLESLFHPWAVCGSCCGLWILHTQRLACVVCHRNVPVERACVVWHILVLQQKMWPDIRFRVRADYRWYDKTPEVGWCGVNEGSCTSTGPREVTRSFPCTQIVRLKLMRACWYALSFCLVSTWNACLVVLPYPVWLHAHTWVTRHRIQRKSFPEIHLFYVGAEFVSGRH